MPMHQSQTQLDADAGAATSGGRRPTIVAAPASASPEFCDRPRRRSFTAADKLRILAEVDAAAAAGGIGAVLRREGLYSSTLGEWRRQRDAGAFGALTPARRGPRIAAINPLADELLRLQRDNARLARRLTRAEQIIGLQKKVAELLGSPMDPNGDVP